MADQCVSQYTKHEWIKCADTATHVVLKCKHCKGKTWRGRP